jgi:hypothetical protein
MNALRGNESRLQKPPDERFAHVAAADEADVNLLEHVVLLSVRKAEILVEKQLAVKVLRQLGFKVKCTLEDYFMTAAGKTRDVVLMMKRLRFDVEEDFFYVF